MQFFRLRKPDWASRTLSNGEPNANFTKEIPGPNVIEGCNYSFEYLTQKNKEGYHIYFFPNRPSKNIYDKDTKFINGKHVDTFEFVFVDMDLKDGNYKTKEEFLEVIRNFKFRPTMVVDSGNGIHVYWRISNLDRDSYLLIHQGLINTLKTDDSVWTVMQLMRAPGFLNTKIQDNFKPVSVLDNECDKTASYTKEEFLEEVKSEITQERIEKVKKHADKLDGKLQINFEHGVDGSVLPDRFLDLMEVKPYIKDIFENPKETVGDRSKADMKLANILFSEGFNIKEAFSVISNTQKALEKGVQAEAYAELTISKVYSDRPKHKFQSAAAFLRDNVAKVQEPQVYGPFYMDYEVLGEPWRRKEILGLIGGSGIGKTAVTLNILEDIAKNNSHNDDVFLFFSLEMSKGQVIKRWVKQVGEASALTEKLYVIDRMDENGLPINIGLQEIYAYAKELKQVTGRHIGAIIVDHFHILSTHIDTKKSPTFGIESEQGTGYGDIKNLSLNGLATQFKALVQSLDTFGILLSQTTKEKGAGDTPLGKDAAYGVSQYEWIVDRIITIWQPLMRIQDISTKRFLAFQYAKIREKTPKDKIQEYDQKLLLYNLENGKLGIPSSEDYQEFCRLLPVAIERSKDERDKDNYNPYSVQGDLPGLKELANLTIKG